MLSGSRSTIGLLGGATFFGTVLTLILPGAVGAAPWIAVVLRVGSRMVPTDALPPRRYETALLSVLLLGSALLFGMLFHELGTYIEYHLFDAHPLSGTKEDNRSEWRAFLRTTYERVPVGHRYIRTVVQKLFFELSICGAFASLGLGLLACRSVGLVETDWPFALAMTSASGTISIFALYAAQDSHDVLVGTRHVLVRGTRPGDVRARHQPEDDGLNDNPLTGYESGVPSSRSR